MLFTIAVLVFNGQKIAQGGSNHHSSPTKDAKKKKYRSIDNSNRTIHSTYLYLLAMDRCEWHT